MLIKEYRICMPISVEEYKRGQQYMINRHSDEQSVNGEGVEVVCNKSHYDEVHGDGKFTEKRIHLNARLPSWARSMFPAIYVTEKAWNYYPYTITEYTCHLLPRLVIFIETKYEDNNGEQPEDNNFDKCDQYATKEEINNRDIMHLDIASDQIPHKSYKEKEDPSKFKSSRTNRGPLKKDWKPSRRILTSIPQGKPVDILLLGHRQAFAWIDQWYDMSFENIEQYEQTLQAKTNNKVLGKKAHEQNDTRSSKSSTSSLAENDGEEIFEDAVSS